MQSIGPGVLALGIPDSEGLRVASDAARPGTRQVESSGLAEAVSQAQRSIIVGTFVGNLELVGRIVGSVIHYIGEVPAGFDGPGPKHAGMSCQHPILL